MGSAKFHQEFNKLDAIAVSAPGNSINALMNNPNIEFVEDDGILELNSDFTKSTQLDCILVEQIPYGVNMV